MAFSGNGIYQNHSGCAMIPDNGPIPPGKYWIVNRGSGGTLSRAYAAILSKVNQIAHGTEFSRSEWFARYRDDMSIDDHTWIEGVSRGLFRLHPGTTSKGCITLVHSSDYAVIRQALLTTQKIRVPCTRDMMAYGMIEVIAHGKNCP
ncbi:DUF2778 domain-containing protein [Mixta theicola]|uniref:DUF2778 domain-containing protein n=1 Tax=Mixta theicola TaxID=1458355 RepID=UPI00235C0AAA|nr:DUF2778 domain-containing protein [Mixta theicola]GLR07287.1 hypothetical protein GCM10007905_00060 [Mixta theicola]